MKRTCAKSIKSETRRQNGAGACVSENSFCATLCVFPHDPKSASVIDFGVINVF